MSAFLKYTYNGKTKKLVFKKELQEIDGLTRAIKEATKSQKDSLLLYYMDQDGQKIVLLNDEDIVTMTKAVRPVNNYYTIYVTKREAALEENIENNIQIMIRYYIGKVRPRFDTVESLKTNEYKEALNKIAAHMNRKKISEYLVKQIVNGIKYQMKTELIEGQLDDIMKKIENQENSVRYQVIRPLNTSVSTIRSVKVSEESKLISIDQNTTFLSPNDASHFNMTVGDILGKYRHRPTTTHDDTIDKSGQIIIVERYNEKFYCKNCKNIIEDNYFECIECDLNVLCIKCEQTAKHNHMLLKRLNDRCLFESD